MPRGVYDRTRARARSGRGARMEQLSERMDRLTSELAQLADDVRAAEGLQRAVDEYYSGQDPTKAAGSRTLAEARAASQATTRGGRRNTAPRQRALRRGRRRKQPEAAS